MNTELWDMLCEDEEVLSFDFENVRLPNSIGTWSGVGVDWNELAEIAPSCNEDESCN